MTKEELVASLIDGSSIYEKDDESILLQFNEERLQALVDNQSTPKPKDKKEPCDGCGDEEEPKDVQNKKTSKEPEKLTSEQWFDQAPEEVQSMARNYHAIEKETRKKLIGQLTANLVDEDVKTAKIEWLQNQKTENLKEMVTLLPPETNNPFRADYTGVDVSLHNSPTIKKPEPLGRPVWDFEQAEATV